MAETRNTFLPQQFLGLEHFRSRQPLEEKNNDRPTKREYVASTELILPFSSKLAYRVFTDLPRQAEWSNYIRRVTYLEPPRDATDIGVTKWTAGAFGIPYSWRCEGSKCESQQYIEWKSISGVQLAGRVDFVPQNRHSCSMRFTMTFVAPRLFAAVFGKAQAMTRFVETHMMLGTLRNFRDTVMQQQQQQQQ